MKKALALIAAGLLALAIVTPALASQPPGQLGHEGPPGHQGGPQHNP